jgi:hypothetical protein
VEAADMSPESSNLFVIQPLGHTFDDAHGVVKHNPGILFSSPISVGVYPVVFEQGLANQVFKRVEEVVGHGMDEPMVLFEMFIPAKGRKFGNHNITIFKSDAVYVVGGHHHTDLFHLYNLSGGIKTFPGLMDYLFMSVHNTAAGDFLSGKISRLNGADNRNGLSR